MLFPSLFSPMMILRAVERIDHLIWTTILFEKQLSSFWRALVVPSQRLSRGHFQLVLVEYKENRCAGTVVRRPLRL
jgi:hypothetical protein